jgi:glycosyltransferase involved in cell wall biosynthesis
MKVLIATPLYPPEIGGPATHTRMLETHLPGHGIETVVVPFSSVKNVPKAFRHFAYFFACWRAANGTDLVFSQDPFSCGMPALIAARLRGLPFVVRIPGDYAWEQARERHGVRDTVEEFQTRRYGFALEMLRAIEHFVVRHADSTVTPSAYIGRVVEAWGPRRLQVIPNGVDAPERATPPPAPPPQPFILTASRLIRGKGFETLIDLIPELPAWQVVIAGSGPLEAELKERAARSAAKERIVFTGAQSKEEMAGWLAAATVFVLATEFETFSFLTAEALAAGVPTIASAVGGIPEIVTDGTHGRLVPPHDSRALKEAIESVIADPEAWKQRTEAGKERARELSSARSAGAFAALFMETGGKVL